MEPNQKYHDLVNEVKKNIKEISIDETKAKLDKKEKIVLIDTREESEWNEKRIDGAIYLGKGIIEREIELTVPNQKTQIVLYCAGGFRSALSAENLQRMGYSNVYSMIGGIKEWEEKGFSINKISL